MTSQHKDNLEVAIAYAYIFTGEARMELRGSPATRREEAALQLMAALNGIDHPEPVRPLVEMCKCHHDHFQHHGTNGGPCTVTGCDCKGFVAVAR